MELKKLVANSLTPVCSALIYLLHNRNTCAFNRLELQSVQFSFSQFGEDLAVLRIVNRLGLSNGIYVDVGAYHPIFGSNTLILHKQGWRGINIDLEPARIASFLRYRPRDHNVVACLSDSVKSVRIAHYQIPSTDRITDSSDDESLSAAGEKPIRFSDAITTTLTTIIEESPFRLGEIQYLNVDCEGHDLAVLRGLDFARWRPQIVSVEAASATERESTVKFLAVHGYHLEVILPPTCILVRNYPQNGQATSTRL
jgi:FkbM family methyltransferase